MGGHDGVSVGTPLIVVGVSVGTPLIVVGLDDGSSDTGGPVPGVGSGVGPKEGAIVGSSEGIADGGSDARGHRAAGGFVRLDCKYMRFKKKG